MRSKPGSIARAFSSKDMWGFASLLASIPKILARLLFGHEKVFWLYYSPSL